MTPDEISYIIFPYHIDGEDYVEAYPLNNRPLFQITARLPSCLIITAPSRNQARKAAYKKWIRNDGKGFNKLSRSPREKKI